MSTKIEQAVDNFKNGFNCSQAVLCPYCEQLGLDRETAFKITTGFGSGMRMGGVCGAVAAAFMAIGLKYGSADAADKESKKNTLSLIDDFKQRFESQNGSVICKDLIGGKSLCTKLVQDAAQILEEIDLH